MDKKYISVYALNRYIKAKFNQDVSLQGVYIKGEISNYRPHPSGHLYFTLKDENSRISAIMFASSASQLDFKVENGMQVLIRANVSVYEASGQYQLYVQSMQVDGVGQLYLKFEQLKKKLENEGLFDPIHKKEIPAFPSSIAVLSAKQGAAVQDIVRTIQLRFPNCRVIVFPIPVQGKNAYLEIIETLKQVDKLHFSTIILARGGGSIEDLWNFNEEALIRCIFDCVTPLVTGIGHETDFTLCDFVSDYRGVTPTAAAIKATPDLRELQKHNSDLYRQLNYKMKHRIDMQRQYLNRLMNAYCLKNPEMIYSHEILRLTALQDKLTHQFDVFYIKNKQQIIKYQETLKFHIDRKIQNQTSLFFQYLASLDALSPLKVMRRGYTLVKMNDEMIKSVHDVKSGDDVDIQFYDGIAHATIK